MSIFESDALELLAARNEQDAQVYAREFVAAVGRTPELATDVESVRSWFAVAFMAGFDRARR